MDSASRAGDGPVLVIEDEPDLQLLLRLLLGRAGYAVAGLQSGFGAVDAARRLRPRAIILDLGLPYRPGGAVLAELKADPATAPIPVLVVTGLPEALGARRALAAAVLEKPVRGPALLAALARAVGAA